MDDKKKCRYCHLADKVSPQGFCSDRCKRGWIDKNSNRLAKLKLEVSELERRLAEVQD